jgi:hypothetical protein
MAVTPTIRVTQAGTLAASSGPSTATRLTQGMALSAINFPTPFIRTTQATVRTVAKPTPPLRLSQAVVLVAVRGRVANPRVRAWTYTLDGHDFYVLRLGDTETLIYDMTTEQWVNWDSFGDSVWRANTGISWLGGHALAQQYGSNILIGDDTFGLLWFLDPERPYDDHPDYLNPAQQIPFDRVVMGQVAARGRGSQPCYAIFLTGDNYGLSVNDFTPAVTLEYSDDAGKTYESAGTITVTPDSVEPPYSWYSLGQIGDPGRLFKITDNGVFTRIDDMQMNDQ